VTVHWTDTALQHLTAIHDYIARNSQHYAQRMVDRITHRTQNLRSFPFLGSVVPEYDNQAIRFAS